MEDSKDKLNVVIDADGVAIPSVRVPVKLLERYGEFFQACVKLNGQMLNGGSLEELEQVLTIAGYIVGFAYAAMKTPLDCINKVEA